MSTVNTSHVFSLSCVSFHLTIPFDDDDDDDDDNGCDAYSASIPDDIYVRS